MASFDDPAIDTAPEGRVDRERELFRDVVVLVVEDDFIVAFDMQTLLEERGARVIGPASTLAEASALVAQHAPDVALLDVNLNGEFVFPVADQLRARGVPFAFATAYADDDRIFPPALRTIPRLAKPVLPSLLVGQLRRLIGR